MLSCSRICLPNSCTSVVLRGQLQRSGLLLVLSMCTHHLVVRQQAADSGPCNSVGHLKGAMIIWCVQQKVDECVTISFWMLGYSRSRRRSMVLSIEQSSDAAAPHPLLGPPALLSKLLVLATVGVCLAVACLTQ